MPIKVVKFKQCFRCGIRKPPYPKHKVCKDCHNTAKCPVCKTQRKQRRLETLSH